MMLSLVVDPNLLFALALGRIAKTDGSRLDATEPDACWLILFAWYEAAPVDSSDLRIDDICPCDVVPHEAFFAPTVLPSSNGHPDPSAVSERIGRNFALVLINLDGSARTTQLTLLIQRRFHDDRLTVDVGSGRPLYCAYIVFAVVPDVDGMQ